MTNIESWDRIAARQPNGDPQTDTVIYGPDGPAERELRLIGDVKGKRVLELGCGTGQAAVTLAKQGATVIAVDVSTVQLAHARRLMERAEVRIEWHETDLADLAFLRADSIDVALERVHDGRGRRREPVVPASPPSAATGGCVRVLLRAPVVAGLVR